MFGGGPIGPGGGGGRGDKSLSMGLMETFKAAWADPDLRSRLLFVLGIFGVFVFGAYVPVPIPGISPATLEDMLKNNQTLQLLNIFGGGAFRRVSIFALGLSPYITASIIMQILTTAFPQWKKEMQEGGEYARKQQNRRTRLLTLFLCVFQGAGMFALIRQAVPSADWQTTGIVVTIWTAGAMFVLWLGEQISEKGIGNGVSLMIFAGIVLSLPYQFQNMSQAVKDQQVSIIQVILMVAILLATTWFIVYFTVAQRRIPIQHMRPMAGTKNTERHNQ